jgi:AcrR family transcriptional regulator
VDVSRAAARASARARILDAAVKLIAREGINDVRIARIAMEAGVSPSLLHYHFASRDALLAEALEHSYELAGSSRTGAGEPAAARLREMIDQCLPYGGALRDDWLLWVELWLHAARRPELRETAARLYARMHAWFMEAIAEGIASGELTVAEPERLTDRLLALIDGYGIRALSEDPAMPVERAREEIWAAIAPELGLA